MAKRVGLVTPMDNSVIDFLNTHHIPASAVYGWASAGEAGDVTVMSISFHVSGATELPAPDGTWEPAAQFQRLVIALRQLDVLPRADMSESEIVEHVVAIVDEWHVRQGQQDMSTDMPTEQFSTEQFQNPEVRRWLGEPIQPFNPNEPRPYTRPIKDNPQG